jgi:hypothetical protein
MFQNISFFSFIQCFISCHCITKELLQWLFPPVSNGWTTAVIESAAKFNNGFVENHYKSFTAVLIEQALQNIIYNGF